MKIQTTYRKAFSLIEVTLALGIAAFCLLTVFGLLPIGLNSTQAASEQTVVSGIATAISSDIHGPFILPTVPSTSGTFSPRFNLPIPYPNYAANATAPAQISDIYFAEDGSQVGTTASNGSGQIAKPTAGAIPRYRARITMVADPTIASIYKGKPYQPSLYKVWIFITWPALADPNPATFPQNFAGSYELSTSVNLFNNVP